jgi:hypothetical protein
MDEFEDKIFRQENWNRKKSSKKNREKNETVRVKNPYKRERKNNFDFESDE